MEESLSSGQYASATSSAGTSSDLGMKIDWRYILGRVEMDTRMIRTAQGIEGQGRSRHYDGEGKLFETTPWETSCVMTMGDPDPAPWWRFWDRSPTVHDFPDCVLATLDVK